MDATDSLLEMARETALLAGELVRDKWHQPRQLSHKGFRDVVTDADFAVQKLITDRIRGRFPHHGFLTEEEDSSLPPDGPVIWIIDPIDGTTNYSRQVPIVSISIAAAMPIYGSSNQVGRYDPVVGVIYDPMRDELFSAVVGQGATLNNRPIQTSLIDGLSQAIISIDWSHQPHKRQMTLNMIQQFAHELFTMRAIGSAALALAWMAAGRIDGYLNYHLKPWDIAAAGLLVQEAGGRVTHMQGEPWVCCQEVADCAASNGRIHQQFLDLLI